MTEIFFGKHRSGGVGHPVDAQRGICYRDAAVGLRGVVVVAFILEHSDVAQNGESMGESAGYEELTVIVFRQFNGDMTAVCGRSLADVDGDIKHSALDTPHQLALGERGTLEMQSAHYTAGRHRLIVLNKAYRTHLLVKFFLRIALEEVSAGVLEYARFDYDHALYVCLYYFHLFGFTVCCLDIGTGVANLI